MSATQTDPVHSIAVRIASVLSNYTGKNAALDSNTIQFAAQLSAIWTVDSNANDITKPANPIGSSSSNLNEPAVTSSHMQALKPQSGLVGTPDSLTPLPAIKADMKAVRPAPEQDDPQSSGEIVQTTASAPAANRRSSASATAVASIAKDWNQTTDQPPGALRVPDNVKAHQVDSKPPAVRKPSRTHDQAPLDPTSSTTVPAAQPGVSPEIPPEPTRPAPVTSVSLQWADTRTTPPPEVCVATPSANARPAERLSTSLTSKDVDRVTAQLSATAPSRVVDAQDSAAKIMPVSRPDVAVPVAASSGTMPAEQGVGIPLTVAYVPIASPGAPPSVVATIMAPSPITLPGHDPNDQPADALPSPVDEAPAATAVKPRRSSSVIDPPGPIDPAKSEAVKDDAVFPDIVPVALCIPVVTTTPVVPETTTVAQPGPVAPLPETPALPNLVAAAFDKQANPQASAQAQVGNSLLTLASGPDGSSQMALTLHPKELGAVHIQLDRTPNGVVRIVVTASEPATLRSLMNDQAHLHAALDAASIPTAGRTLSFELGTPPAGPAVTPGHAAFPSVVERVQDTISALQTNALANVDMPGFRGSDAQAGNGGRDPGNAFSRNGRDPGSDSDTGNIDDSPTISKSSSSAPRSSGGINITA